MTTDLTPEEPKQEAEDLERPQSRKKWSGKEREDIEGFQLNSCESALRQRNEELAALRAFGLSVNTHLSPEETAVSALQKMLNAVRCDLVFLFLREDEGLILKHVLPSTALQGLGVFPEHRVGQCMCGLTVREGKPLFSRNIFDDPRCTWEECKKAGLMSLATLPLSSGDEIIGVIGLASESERDFGQQARFLETLAAQVSVALTNARLFEMVKKELADRKRSEEAMRESEERFRALVTASSEVLYRMSPDWSEMRQLHIRGFLADTERPTRTWVQEYIHPDDQAHLTDTINEAIRTKSVFEMEHRVRRVDGSLGWTFSRAVPLTGPKGEIVEWFGAANDITERRQAEQRLVEAERQFRTLAENAPDIIVRFDNELHYTYANPAIERYTRIPCNRFLGKTNGAIGMPPQLTARWEAGIRRVFEAGVREMLEFDYATPERTISFQAWAVPELNEEGEVESVLCIVRDVSELQQARDELEARVQERTAELVQSKTMLEREVLERRRAEATLRAREEERERLNDELRLEIEKRKRFEEALKSSTEKIIEEHNHRKALSRQLVELLENDRREVAMALHDHAGQILTTLKMDLESIENKMGRGPERLKLEAAKNKALELLAFTKETSAQLRPSTLDTLGLVASIRNLIDQLQTAARQKISFHAGDLPARMGEDIEIALYRIIQESLNNALKYAHAESIHVNLFRKGKQNALLLSIEDDGRGFDCAHEPVARPEAGHMGITIMRERAVLLGGNFHIESRPGKGTVVMVEVPLGQ